MKLSRQERAHLICAIDLMIENLREVVKTCEKAGNREAIVTDIEFYRGLRDKITPVTDILLR